VKKSLHFVFVPVFALFIISYILFFDVIHSFVFTLLQSTIPSKVSMSKIAFVDGSFSMDDYSKLTEKIRSLDNSVALFLPQVFNIRINEYLEDINPDELKKIKDDYRNFTLKLAEAQNIIPVVFLSSDGREKNQVDPSAFKYFDAKSFGMKLPEYNYAKIASVRVWQSITSVGFYREYDYYPYRIPAVFNYNGSVLAGAPVEAIRKYYKLTRSRISMEGDNLRIGDIISFPLQSGGDIMVHQLRGAPEKYSLGSFMDAPREKLEDKIIIVRSGNISEHTMLSLGVACASILQGTYINYSPAMNYTAAALVFLIFFLAYRSIKFRFGIVALAASEAAVFYACSALMAANIYADFSLIAFADFSAFFIFYFYSVAGKMADSGKRRGVLLRAMHPKAVRPFMEKNLDVKIKNIWSTAFVMYVTFDETEPMDAENIKKTFDKTRELIYNKTGEFIIKRHCNSGLAVVFLAENQPLRAVVDAAIELRDKLRGFNFNIILNSTEVYVFEHAREIGFLDRKYGQIMPAETVEKKKYIIVPEADIQKYVSTVKFQKIYEKAGTVLFNITGVREEAVNEN
jgi:hypothetical protein